MQTFDTYLNQFKRAKGIEFDKDLAEVLQVTKAYVSQIRRHGLASDELCLTIATELGIPAAEVMIARNALREPGAVGQAWKEYAGKMAAAMLMVSVGTTALPDSVDAGNPGSLYYRK